MNWLRFILLLLAVICFLAAAFEVKSQHINPLGMGLALWAFAEFIGTIK